MSNIIKFFLLVSLNIDFCLGQSFYFEIFCNMVATSDNLDEICQLIDSEKFSKISFCPHEEVNLGACSSLFDFCLYCPNSENLTSVKNSNYTAEIEARFYEGNSLLILQIEKYIIKTSKVL